MVFEQLYSSKWIEQKARYAFLMGVSYAIIGIASAMLLFPEDPGLVAIAFTSLLIVPSLNKLLSIEAKQAAVSKGFVLARIFKDHWDIIKVYIFLFLGIMLAFAFFSLVWPSVATSAIFREQSNVIGSTGHAIYGGQNILNALILNNLKVLVFCLIASLVYGSGAVFIITWNASVWGTIFGMIAKNSALVAGQNPFAFFLITLIAVFPHLILEASSYFLAVISGGIISKAVIHEKIFSRRFQQIMQDGLVMFVLALIVLFIAAFIEANYSGSIMGLLGL